jgi:hypothetical protein
MNLAVGSLVDKASKGLRKGLSLLVARVKALRRAVRVDNFRLAQRLRMGLVLHLKHLKQPLRDDVARLFDVSGLWVRNVGDRHQTKRTILRISRHIMQRLQPLVADPLSLPFEEAPPNSGSTSADFAAQLFGVGGRPTKRFHPQRPTVASKT